MDNPKKSYINLNIRNYVTKSTRVTSFKGSYWKINFTAKLDLFSSTITYYTASVFIIFGTGSIEPEVHYNETI